MSKNRKSVTPSKKGRKVKEMWQEDEDMPGAIHLVNSNGDIGRSSKKLVFHRKILKKAPINFVNF